MSTSMRNMAPQVGATSPLHEGEHLHFRLCHVCLHLNEADDEIIECSECQHAFKDDALTQFFKDNDDEAFTDANPEAVVEEAIEEEESDSPKLIKDLNGLSVRF